MWSWAPTLLVVVVTAMALTGASSPPGNAAGRRVWMASIMVCGCLAIAGTVWQGQKGGDNPATLSGTTTSPETFSKGERSGPTIADLTMQLRALEERVKELQAGRQVRTITPDTAEKFAAYLRGFGTHRVIVSSIPDDFEAYQYANQLVTILKAANWDAQGPEATKIFGDLRSPGVNFYVNAENHSDTATILLDGFAKFNIPYQSRVTPTQAIPDTETVELFIGSMRPG